MLFQINKDDFLLTINFCANISQLTAFQLYFQRETDRMVKLSVFIANTIALKKEALNSDKNDKIKRVGKQYLLCD